MTSLFLLFVLYALADAVFTKAMEVSSSSFNESDLDACFGDLKGQYGNTLNKLYSNLASRVDHSIQASLIRFRVLLPIFVFMVISLRYSPLL